ncbi:MAG: hypothetical protein R2822_23855 [Spirosomataceae bacterium]
MLYLHLFEFSLACTLIAQDRLSGRSFATRTVVMAQNGMAVPHP